MAANPRAAKPYILPQANPYGRVDEEVSTVAQREEKRKKRMKCLSFAVAFILFQTGVILLFGLTVMKVRTPRFRVRSAAFDAFTVAATTDPPSFDIRMVAELAVKNANFGHYKYQNATVEFYYRGIRVGGAAVVRGRARARSTGKFNVTVDLSSAGVAAELLSDGFRANDGVIPLTSRSKLRGKVELMKLMKKNKSSDMNCTMGIDISSKQLQNILCR